MCAAFRAYPNYGISLTLNDINNSTQYNRVNAYGQSKLSNILFVQELQNRILSKGNKRLQNVEGDLNEIRDSFKAFSREMQRDLNQALTIVGKIIATRPPRC